MGRGTILNMKVPACLLFVMLIRSHLDQAIAAAGGNISGYHDFRELIARPDIDIVHIATPPHWHGIIAKNSC